MNEMAINCSTPIGMIFSAILPQGGTGNATIKK